MLQRLQQLKSHFFVGLKSHFFVGNHLIRAFNLSLAWPNPTSLFAAGFNPDSHFFIL
jgi:hypothetical protein